MERLGERCGGGTRDLEAPIHRHGHDATSGPLDNEPYPYPALRINRKPPTIFDYEFEDFTVENYRHHPTIKAPIAV